ncbi:MAG: GntR family transcriptional regulator [Anaerolineae bacterium]|nr:GntR family transcriptional regulator [Anaerolineae bacterium]
MSLELDRRDPTPIYIQIKHWMRQQIKHGVWPEHYKLTAETILAVELGVSRGTVRQAIMELIEEGLLTRIHGRGTFVASAALEQPLAEQFVTFSEDLIAKGIAFETHVLAQSIMKPTEIIASLLNIRADDDVFFLKRVRSIGDEPLVILENYLAYPRCRGIEQFDFTQYRLFEVLEEHLGLDLDWGRRSFEARAADAKVADLLRTTASSPVMFAEQIVYLADGSPIELSNLWFKGEKFKLSATLKRDRKALSSQRTLSQEYQPGDA